MKRTIRSTAGWAVAVLFAASASTVRAAGDAPPSLPFTPPAGWQSMPGAFIPKLPVAWMKGRALFEVTELTTGMPADALGQVLKVSAQALGKVTAESSLTVCGATVPRVVVRTSSEQILTEQAQTLAGSTYISLYLRQATMPEDPAIVHLMSTVCDNKALLTLTPPNGWHAYRAELLGIWIGASPAQTLVAMATNPQPNLTELMDAGVAVTVKNPNLTIVSHRTGKLCGNPAFFTTARAKAPGSTLMLEVQMAATQSAKTAYVLIYSHPVSLPADAKAGASLDTLCASPTVDVPPPSAVPSTP